jgi:peroxiredoxin
MMNRRNFMQSAMASGLAMTGAFSLAHAGPTKQTYELLSTDVFGKKLGLNDFSGKVALISFFTLDCLLCSTDLKLMREFYARNKAKNFTLVGVNLDQNKQDLDDYNEAMSLVYSKNHRFPTVWRNAKGHQDNFGKITSEPSHFVLDANHQLLFKREGKFLPDDWDKLWELLG